MPQFKPGDKVRYIGKGHYYPGIYTVNHQGNIISESLLFLSDGPRGSTWSHWAPEWELVPEEPKQPDAMTNIAKNELKVGDTWFHKSDDCKVEIKFADDKVVLLFVPDHNSHWCYQLSEFFKFYKPPKPQPRVIWVNEFTSETSGNRVLEGTWHGESRIARVLAPNKPNVIQRKFIEVIE